MDEIQAIIEELSATRTLVGNILADRCIALRREVVQLTARNKTLTEQVEKQAEEIAELKKPTLAAVG